MKCSLFGMLYVLYMLFEALLCCIVECCKCIAIVGALRSCCVACNYLSSLHSVLAQNRASIHAAHCTWCGLHETTVLQSEGDTAVLDINACNAGQNRQTQKQNAMLHASKVVLIHNYKVVKRDKYHSIMYQIRQSQQGGVQVELGSVA